MESADSLFLIEDAEDVREYLTEELSETFNVTPFPLAKNCLEALENGTLPDVFVTDFKMPHMDGVELVKAIQAEKIEVPIIILTGAADKTMAIKSIELGVFGILEKPCSKVEVESMANKAITQHRSIKLVSRILGEFQNFIRHVDEWSDSNFNHIIHLENKLYENNIINKTPQEAATDMRIRRQMRLTEKTVRQTQSDLDDMLKDYQKLKKAAGI